MMNDFINSLKYASAPASYTNKVRTRPVLSSPFTTRKEIKQWIL